MPSPIDSNSSNGHLLEQLPVREVVGPIFTTLISEIKAQIEKGALTPPENTTKKQVLYDLELMQSMLNMATQHPEALDSKWQKNLPSRRDNKGEPSPTRLVFFSEDRDPVTQTDMNLINEALGESSTNPLLLAAVFVSLYPEDAPEDAQLVGTLDYIQNPQQSTPIV